MSTTTETTIQNIHAAVADQIEGFNAAVAIDDAGYYISLTEAGADNQRGLSLTDDGGSEDLDAYRWIFWNEADGTMFESDLTADAETAEVIAFLNDSLDEEVAA